MGLYKRGPVWWMRFTYKGRQIRNSTETADKKTAEKIYHKVLTLIAEGKWFEKSPDVEKTFKEMMDRYMEEHSKPKKASSWRDTASLKHLVPFLGDYTIMEITPSLINQYKTKRRLAGASPSTVNRELSLMKHGFNIAIREWEWIRENPVMKVSMEKEPPARDRYLLYVEEENLLQISPLWLREIIVFAVETGCRQGEILSLSWRDVDLNKRTANVFATKTEDRRAIPLSARVFNMLKEKGKIRSISTNFVFALNDNGINRFVLSNAFEKVCKQAGIEGLRFHDLRHTFATRLAQAGIDPYTIQRLLGHKTASMTQRYSHHCVESLRRGIEVFERVRKEEAVAQN